MTKKRPLVQAAVCAEKVLREADGIISIIRVVDIFRVHYPSKQVKEGTPPSPLQVASGISLKSGDVIGEYTVRVRHRTPTGGEQIVYEWLAEFKGGGHGPNVVLNTTFGIKEFGLHWFDVVWE